MTSNTAELAQNVDRSKDAMLKVMLAPNNEDVRRFLHVSVMHEKLNTYSTVKRYNWSMGPFTTPKTAIHQPLP